MAYAVCWQSSAAFLRGAAHIARLDAAGSGAEGASTTRWLLRSFMNMARVRNIPSRELPPDLAAIYERFSTQYGPFRNQAAAFAHVPAALRHLMAMLIELREAATLPKRVL